jgi:LysR family glycine cleavage system transcriptional activator
MKTDRRLPPLGALRAFETAARRLSFSAAADELAVTPSAVSHQVAQLEDAIGVKLFRRFNRAVELTEAGRACLPVLTQGFDLLAEAVTRARGADRNLLTVSTSPGLAAKWLMPRIERFRAQHPEIDLRIDASMRLVDFHRDDVQIALRYGRGNYPGLHVERLMPTEAFPACAPRLLRGAAKLRKPADLARHTLIHDESTPGDPSYPDWAMWLRAAGVANVDTARGLRFNSVALAMDAAIAGRGVVLARSVFAADDLAARRLVRPFGAAVPLDFSVFVVTSPALLEIAKVRAFRDWLMAEAQAITKL